MPRSEAQVVIVGAGAAGIAAGRRLGEVGVDALLIEARSRIGGRAWTVDIAGHTLDLGCGWLHSANRNCWTPIATDQGRAIDRSLPPWERQTAQLGAKREDTIAFGSALGQFRRQVSLLRDDEPDRAAVAFLDPDSRWNQRVDAVSTYYSGVELRRISARDLARYEDSGTNWRVREGYGTVVAAHGADLAIELGCEAIRIDHRAQKLRVETNRGPISAEAVILTLPTALIAKREDFFSPTLPNKIRAAADLPLGLADKLFLALSNAKSFEPESRAFGKVNSVETAGYHLRPFGRPLIEAYFGGELAARLELGGQGAFFDFARTELVGLFGSEFGRRIAYLGLHGWRGDAWAMGSYSYALPDRAESRAILAAPVDDRLFFAGEACSKSSYSTAHGAYETGIHAANQALAALASGKK
jgi:monoamine oxidase